MDGPGLPPTDDAERSSDELESTCELLISGTTSGRPDTNEQLRRKPDDHDYLLQQQQSRASSKQGIVNRRSTGGQQVLISAAVTDCHVRHNCSSHSWSPRKSNELLHQLYLDETPQDVTKQTVLSRWGWAWSASEKFTLKRRYINAMNGWMDGWIND